MAEQLPPKAKDACDSLVELFQAMEANPSYETYKAKFPPAKEAFEQLDQSREREEVPELADGLGLAMPQYEWLDWYYKALDSKDPRDREDAPGQIKDHINGGAMAVGVIVLRIISRAIRMQEDEYGTLPGYDDKFFDHMGGGAIC